MSALFGLFSLTSCGDDDTTVAPISPEGTFIASDQMLDNGTITVGTVTMDEAGWVVIHRDNGNGGPQVPGIISVPEQVAEGTSTNVVVELEEGEEIGNGETLWIMLHTDDGQLGVYEFDGSNGLDAPLTDNDGNVVTASIEVTTGPTGSFMANNQTLNQNTLTISSVEMSVDGWVVIHKDNGNGGPVVPAIVSVPKMVEAGTNTNVVVEIEADTELEDGETLWVMLHTDTGTEGVYEFDGNNGLDGPIFDVNNNVVVAPVTIDAPAIVANDQAVVNNQIVIAQVDAAVDGWIVVHNDDGTGSITLPGIVGKTMVSAGMNTNVVIDLDENETYMVGQKLFPMLHIDAAPMGEYNFPGDDTPEMFGFDDDNIIMTSITVQ